MKRRPNHLPGKLSLKNGFTLVELMITIVIVSILSGAGYFAYRSQTKKAHATEIKAQLSAAAKKLTVAVSGHDSVDQATCLAIAELNDSSKFSYACSQRDDGSDIFDIHVKPINDYGVGGVLSFGIGHDKICWDTCDAFGYGGNTVLAKNHLAISSDCVAVTRKERTYNCNCSTERKQTGRRAIKNCTTWVGCRTVGWQAEYGMVETCDTCTDISYINEQGIAVDLN